MKIGMQVCGGDGDILPFMTLATGLSSVGHDVTIVVISFSGKNYSHIAKASGFEYLEVECIRRKVFRAKDWDICNMKSIITQKTALYKLFLEPNAGEMYNASKKLCQENDIVISYRLAHTLITASEKYNCPLVMLHCSPLGLPSKYMTYTGKNMGVFLNNLMWKITDFSFLRQYGKYINKLRGKVGLKPVKGIREVYLPGDLNLIAVSEALSIRQPDWQENVHMTGFFNPIDVVANWEMPESLRVFLDGGEPPVFMTLGSIAEIKPLISVRMLINAVKRSGKRAIIQSTFSGLSDLFDDNPDIYRLDRGPYEEIFPYCSVIVHHGGAGTVRASLLSGKPSVIVEQAFDNIYWGRRLEELGASGKLLHGRTVKAKDISHEINRVLKDLQITVRAQKLGEAIAREDGLSRTIELIENKFENLFRQDMR